MKEARYYRKLGDGRVQCQFCFRGCIIGDGQ